MMGFCHVTGGGRGESGFGVAVQDNYLPATTFYREKYSSKNSITIDQSRLSCHRQVGRGKKKKTGAFVSRPAKIIIVGINGHGQRVSQTEESETVDYPRQWRPGRSSAWDTYRGGGRWGS